MKKFDLNLFASASRICGRIPCRAPFACAHANHMDDTVPKLGRSETCPLEQYEVQPDGSDDGAVTLRDIQRLCAACPHSEVVIRRKNRIFVRTDYVDVCVDCPVKAAEDAIYAQLEQKYANLETMIYVSQ